MQLKFSLRRKVDRLVDDCQIFSVDEAVKTLVFLASGYFLYHFWFALICREILGVVITTFLGFVEHCTVDISRRSLVPRLY